MSDKDLDSDLDDDGAMDTDDKVVDSETEKQLLSGSSDESSTGSDDDDDDEDAEMDAEDAARSRVLQTYFETLEKINKNKYSYDDYVVLVNLAV